MNQNLKLNLRNLVRVLLPWIMVFFLLFLLKFHQLQTNLIQCFIVAILIQIHSLNLNNISNETLLFNNHSSNHSNNHRLKEDKHLWNQVKIWGNLHRQINLLSRWNHRDLCSLLQAKGVQVHLQSSAWIKLIQVKQVAEMKHLHQEEGLVK